MTPRPVLLLPALFAAVFLAALPARAFDTTAKAAYVFDITTNTVLFEKQADVALPPASMSKLMTLNMLFEALKDGRLALDTRLGVSERARSMGGSSMYLDERDRPTVEELIQGIIVQSGNDACVVVAEALGGTEEAFAEMMTQRAADLGMANSSFGNASGWPHPLQRMSMRDLGILATRLITEFPQFYHYFGQPEFAFDGRAPGNHFNRNPLLKLGAGADGLKTGHTVEAGYGLVGSALQGKRRIVFVVSGLPSQKARAQAGEAVINWAFRQFTLKNVVEQGAHMADAQVWLGDAPSVGMVAGESVTLLVPALQHDGLAADIRWKGPIQAPVTKGQTLGEMVIHRRDLPDTTIALVAAADVGEAGFMARLSVAASRILSRVRGDAAPLTN